MHALKAGAILLGFFLPFVVVAATLRADESLQVSEPLPGNAYLAGAHVEVNAPLSGDLLALGSLIRVRAPVLGDVLLAGGTISLDAPIAEDARLLGGQILADETIGGEFAALGGLIRVSQKVGEIRVAGGTVEVLGGASGPVTIYGNKVVLTGVFDSSVRVVASDSVTLTKGTTIQGVFEYNAPQEAVLADDVSIAGGAHYIGSSSFLPTAKEAQAFAVAGFGVYFVVRIVAGMLVAGLVAGLFPRFSEVFAREALRTSKKHTLLQFVIGFCALVGVPIVLILLLVSVVGIGVGLLLGSAYVLALLLSYIGSAILAGALIGKYVFKKDVASWHMTILGVFVLYLLGFVPGIGFLVTLLFVCVSFGTLLTLFWKLAFVAQNEHGTR